MGAALVPLLTTAIGVGVNQYNTNQTEKKTRNELSRQLANSAERDKQGKALVDATLAKQRASGPEAVQADSLDDYMSQLRKTQGLASGGLSQVGDVSDRYAEDATAANADIFNTSAARADMLSRIDAPQLQRQDEGIAFGRLASDIGQLQSKAEGDRFLNDLRLRLASKRNAAMDAAGSALTSYGSSGGDFGLGSSAGSLDSAGSIYNFGNNVDALRGKKVSYG
jgi:hypothetical protein